MKALENCKKDGQGRGKNSEVRGSGQQNCLKLDPLKLWRFSPKAHLPWESIMGPCLWGFGKVNGSFGQSRAVTLMFSRGNAQQQWQGQAGQWSLSFMKHAGTLQTAYNPCGTSMILDPTQTWNDKGIKTSAMKSSHLELFEPLELVEPSGGGCKGRVSHSAMLTHAERAAHIY